MKSYEIFPRGTLAVVATPLGNPGDMTLRALEIIGEADVIAAEDTRNTARLLAYHKLKKPLVSYHDWNEGERAKELVERLRRGEKIALLSDAGTPGISDPGFDVVRLAREAGLKVFPVPGPSALTAFLSASGLPTDAFTFHGFPPNRKGKRRNFFQKLHGREETQVFYESPHRILDTLEDALEILGDRTAALGREMTKEYEEFFYGPITGIIEKLQGPTRVRGEVVWGVRGNTGEISAEEEETLESAMEQAIASGAPLKAAAKELSARFGVPVKEIYAKLNGMKK
jgi:16S rRNA (cytidine1402-2'-O)-methyltransferase